MKLSCVLACLHCRTTQCFKRFHSFKMVNTFFLVDQLIDNFNTVLLYLVKSHKVDLHFIIRWSISIFGLIRYSIDFFGLIRWSIGIFGLTRYSIGIFGLIRWSIGIFGLIRWSSELLRAKKKVVFLVLKNFFKNQIFEYNCLIWKQRISTPFKIEESWNNLFLQNLVSLLKNKSVLVYVYFARKHSNNAL